MSPSDALGEALAEKTLALCRIPSVTGDEAACADAVERWLAATPYAVERHGNVVLARDAGPPDDRPLVLLVGHTDTVPPKPTDGPPRRDGDRLYGLGASDMKGGLAVMLHLAEHLAPATSSARLGLVFYDREEGPWADSGLGPALEAAQWLHEAALAFCLEPSDNEIQVGCLGSMHLRVVFHGKAAHSARPWQGRNAIQDAGPLLLALAGAEPRDIHVKGHLFREVLSVTLASGGRTRNVVPDRFELNLNLRFAPHRTLDGAEIAARSWIAAALGATEDRDGALRRDDGLHVEITAVERAPAGRVVTDNPWLERFVAHNGNRIAAKQAWTDVARLTAAGIDAVNLGPGLAAQAHQAGEHCEIPLLAASYRQFERFFTAGA